MSKSSPSKTCNGKKKHRVLGALESHGLVSHGKAVSL